MIEELLTYYRQNKRDLPWRRNHDPYRIWISEIMCQQTQVQTVTPYFNRFMELFPDVKTLAEADDDTLMKSWQNLGYYSRAKNLKKAAQKIMSDYSGVFPKDYDAVLSLAGIGDYTACAICSMAYNQPYVSIDGNFLRVFSRFCADESDISLVSTKKALKEKLLALPIGEYGDFNQAVMDLGATVCHAKNPLCEQCPLSDECLAHRRHCEEDYPVNLAKTKIETVDITVVIIRQNGRILIRKHEGKGLLSGLYEFVYFDSKLNEQQLTGLYPNKRIVKKEMKTHHFSHRVWKMTPYLIETEDYQCNGNERFVTLEEIKMTYSMAKAFNQFLNLLD